jgi:hypothetical protein
MAVPILLCESKERSNKESIRKNEIISVKGCTGIDRISNDKIRRVKNVFRKGQNEGI